MSGWLDVVRDNVSFTSFANMRNLFGEVPFLSLFSAAASTASFHQNTGVLDFVNPKIGTYGVTPNGNGGEQAERRACGFGNGSDLIKA